MAGIVKVCDITVEMFDYWHAGSGRGRSTVYDGEVVRTEGGLPYLPGKTLRGLIREGMTLVELSGLGEVRPGTTAELFGKGGEKADSDGCVHVTDATLGEEFEKWGKSISVHVRESLFDSVSSTAIDPDKGTAAEHSLRTFEVTVPMKLTAGFYMAEGAKISHGEVKKLLEVALRMIRGLGKTRRRGFGRAELNVTGGEARI